jgi:hypothetical protein
MLDMELQTQFLKSISFPYAGVVMDIIMVSKMVLNTHVGEIATVMVGHT